MSDTYNEKIAKMLRALGAEITEVEAEQVESVDGGGCLLRRLKVEFKVPFFMRPGDDIRITLGPAYGPPQGD